MMDDFLKLQAENERMYALLCEAERELQFARDEMMAMDPWFEPESRRYTSNQKILDKLEKFFKDKTESMGD